MPFGKKPSSTGSTIEPSETILNSEITGWVQQMQSAMAKIYEQKPKQ
jgi:hypothetical protein